MSVLAWAKAQDGGRATLIRQPAGFGDVMLLLEEQISMHSQAVEVLRLGNSMLILHLASTRCMFCEPLIAASPPPLCIALGTPCHPARDQAA